MTNNREHVLDRFIDDLNNDTKPKIYHDDQVTPELERDFEMVRKIKRAHFETDTSTQVNSTKNKNRYARLAVAALLILSLFLGNMLSNNDIGIVQAMVESYQEITGYKGNVVVRSISNGEVDHETTRQIKFQKPYQYKAVEQWDEVVRKNISDGDTLWMINETTNEVEIESLFPEQELWRYHIGTQISELENAIEVKEVGEEEIIERQTKVIEYKYHEEEGWHRMWVDINTNMPLKKELNSGEDSKLVVEYQELELDPDFSEGTFRPELDFDDYQVKETRNRLMADIEELTDQFDHQVYNLADHLNIELTKIGHLDYEIDWLYQGVLRYQGNSNKFLDMYQSKPEQTKDQMLVTRTGELGSLGDGNSFYLNKNVTGLFDTYHTQVNLVRFQHQGIEIAFVSNISSDELIEITEALTGKQVNFFTDTVPEE